MTHRAIYAAPFVYDLAFSYRDIDRERTFLADVYERRRGRGPASFVELAAGPARHALAFAAMGIRSHAVDLSPEMVAYGRELADARNVHLAYERGDMRSFTLEAPVDLAACMLASGSYLLTDDDLASHLAAVSRALSAEGVYVMELSHPSELEGPPKTVNEWVVREERGTVEVEWSEGPVDSRTHVRECIARIRFTPPGATIAIEHIDTAMQRVITVDDLERAVVAVGSLEIAGVFGALDESVSLDDAEAWRLVAVFVPRLGGWRGAQTPPAAAPGW